MFEKLESIRNAAQLLAVHEPALTEQLLHAGETLWERMYERGNWPEKYERKADALLDRLTAQGTIEATLDDLNPPQANEVAQHILQFADDINVGNGALA